MSGLAPKRVNGLKKEDRQERNLVILMFIVAFIMLLSFARRLFF